MDLSNKTILVCDDSILARKQLMDAIKSFSEGATFIEGKNGAEAVDLYKNNKPDIVFMDIIMPEMDGTQSLKEIMDFDKNAIVIIVSSIGTRQQLQTAIELGAKDFVQKPIDKYQIEDILESRLGGN